MSAGKHAAHAQWVAINANDAEFVTYQNQGDTPEQACARRGSEGHAGACHFVHTSMGNVCDDGPCSTSVTWAAAGLGHLVSSSYVAVSYTHLRAHETV